MGQLTAARRFSALTTASLVALGCGLDLESERDLLGREEDALAELSPWKENPRRTFVVDGWVDATTRSGSTLYIAGQFDWIGQRSGPFAAVGSKDGIRDKSYPELVGEVRAVVSDGSGGIFIGGNLLRTGSAGTHGLTRIRADKTIDARWEVRFDGDVNALVVRDNTLFAAGSFTTVDGVSRTKLAAFDTRDRSLLPWQAQIAGNVVVALAADANMLYLGGDFRTVQGVPRRNLAALNLVSGAVGSLIGNANGMVRTLVSDESTLFVGGDFGRIGPLPSERKHVAAFDVASGALLSFDPGSDARVRALALAGNRLYVGGEFNQLAGAQRLGLGAVDKGVGTIVGEFDPEVDGYIHALAASESKIYAGGATSLEGGDYNGDHAIALDPAGHRLPWHANVSDYVSTIALTEERVFLGGSFTSTNARRRSDLAALDLGTGRPTAWAPRVPSEFHSSTASGSTEILDMVQVDDAVYLAGGFDHINGVPRQGLAAVDAQSGATLPWDPEVDGLVSALAIADGVAYFGGGFGTIGGHAQPHAGAVDLASGTLIPWKATVEGRVLAVAASGGRVYLGGEFETVEPDGPGPESRVTRRHLAAFAAATGSLLDWNPSAGGDGTVLNLGYVECLVVRGDTIWAGGSFTKVGGITRRGVVRLDANTGRVLSTFDARTDGPVTALALDDNDLYIGGPFTHAGTTPRSGLARLDATTGALRRWNPSPIFDFGPTQFLYTVRSIQPMADAIAVGGTFRIIGPRFIPQTGIAVFPRVDP